MGRIILLLLLSSSLKANTLDRVYQRQWLYKLDMTYRTLSKQAGVTSYFKELLLGKRDKNSQHFNDWLGYHYNNKPRTNESLSLDMNNRYERLLPLDKKNSHLEDVIATESALRPIILMLIYDFAELIDNTISDRHDVDRQVAQKSNFEFVRNVYDITWQSIELSKKLINSRIFRAKEYQMGEHLRLAFAFHPQGQSFHPNLIHHPSAIYYGYKNYPQFLKEAIMSEIYRLDIGNCQGHFNEQL